MYAPQLCCSWPRRFQGARGPPRRDRGRRTGSPVKGRWCGFRTEEPTTWCRVGMEYLLLLSELCKETYVIRLTGFCGELDHSLQMFNDILLLSKTSLGSCQLTHPPASPPFIQSFTLSKSIKTQWLPSRRSHSLAVQVTVAAGKTYWSAFIQYVTLPQTPC